MSSERGIRVPSRTTHLAARQADADDIALGGFDLAKYVAIFLVGHPACFLRIVGFRLVDSLLLERDEEVRGRIGIISLLGLRGWHLGLRLLSSGLYCARETDSVALTGHYLRGLFASSFVPLLVAGRGGLLSSSSSLSFAFGGCC